MLRFTSERDLLVVMRGTPLVTIMCTVVMHGGPE